MERYAALEFFVSYLLFSVAKRHQKSVKMTLNELLKNDIIQAIT